MQAPCCAQTRGADHRPFGTEAAQERVQAWVQQAASGMGPFFWLRILEADSEALKPKIYNSKARRRALQAREETRGLQGSWAVPLGN